MVEAVVEVTVGREGRDAPCVRGLACGTVMEMAKWLLMY